MSKKILIRNTQSPGDIVVLTALIRDLHRQYPGQFLTGVEVSRGADGIFDNNPDISPKAMFKRTEKFVARYPLIHKSNQSGKHFIWGFIEYFNSTFGTDVKLSEFRPALYVSEHEKANRPFDEPYWVFLCGGKKDFTTKLWPQTYWQQLIDMTCDKLNWVQCGTPGHYKHIPKRGIFANMIGKTGLREFITTIYHAEGVVCYMTAAMHIAAAFNKPCVVIGGGREPWWWEAYNTENRLKQMRVGMPDWEPPADDDFVSHQFLHTIGKLSCCQTHGCWKSKIESQKASSCRNVEIVEGTRTPKCKAMITPDMVAEAIAAYDDYVAAGPTTYAPIKIEPVKLTQYLFIPFDAGEAGIKWAKDILAASDRPSVIAYCGDESWPLKRLAEKYEAKCVKVADRLEALRMAAGDGDRVAWLSYGVTPAYDTWLNRLAGRDMYDKVTGRIYRTHDGHYYPGPDFFAGPTTDLDESSDSLPGIFRFLKKADFCAANGMMKLSTTPAAEVE